MSEHFSYEEFYKPEFADDITSSVKFKLDKHIEVLETIRKQLKIPIIVSKHSGFRPYWYEISKKVKRSGNSEHCFKGLGAVDITCDSSRLQELFELVQASHYVRCCLYIKKGFIHCDFKGTEKYIFMCEKGNEWELLAT